MLDFKVNTSIEEKENLPVCEASLEANSFILLKLIGKRIGLTYLHVCVWNASLNLVYIFFQLLKWLLR